jgi:methylase of polypeptide subunit release factors
MNNNPEINELFLSGLEKLGFMENDQALFFLNTKNKLSDPQIRFHLENAGRFKATAVFLLKQLNGSYKPQVYLYDYTDTILNSNNEKEITRIQKMIWSSGETPLACILYNSSVSIVNCTDHIIENANGEFEPAYLVRNLNLAENANALYNKHFALRIQTGLFWEQHEMKRNFRFHNKSAYSAIITNIKTVIGILSKKLKNEKIHETIINKIIIQAILIKYLEEYIDNNNNKLLQDKYFQKYDGAKTFNDVLRSRHFPDLLKDLNNDFNGNVFKWNEDEQKQLKGLDLSIVAELLTAKRVNIGSTQMELNFDWRYFEFRFIPVELISRLYETFLGDDRREKGLYYTPSHLVKLLVDECLPLNKYRNIDVKNFTVLDPACGSGIFLVVVFKRLVQIWRLQNNMRHMGIRDLKLILCNLYGTDKEEQAVQLTAFSLTLALCNELEPVTIINELEFNDLREKNILYSDFFVCEKMSDKKFDLIIGNPPFRRGAVSEYSGVWQINETKIKIPQGQIALKFLSESLEKLKSGGLLCMIIKASGLLYNSSSKMYKKALFSRYNVVQILDFTALARNKSLWDNGADVASAAVFVKNEMPDYTKNILHVTFRRTKATIERILFEIDDYDLHFVNRSIAITNPYIWKINLLGGGRISHIIDRLQSLPKLQEILTEHKCISGEGYIIGKKGNLTPGFIYKVPTLPTVAISENGIDYSKLREMDRETKFVKVGNPLIFEAPNIIIWENIGDNKFSIFKNDMSFSFKHKIIGIKPKNNQITKSILQSFNLYADIYRFYIFTTSSQVLINLNTALLKRDLMQLRFILNERKTLVSKSERKIISDVNDFYQDFVRHGENSKALRPIDVLENRSVIVNYGGEFVDILNAVYGKNNRRFRLSDVVFDKSLIAVVFRYDAGSENIRFHHGFTSLNIDGFLKNDISSRLSANRIIKMYPQKDMIVFVKPNQYRYWLSLVACRDADKCLADFADKGL